MPIVSVATFARDTGKKPKDIHAYIAQGVVVKTKEGYIDTDNAKNALFQLKHQPKVIIDAFIEETDNDFKEPDNAKSSQAGTDELEHWKIEIAKRQVTRHDIAIEKANAVLIPTDLVKTYNRYGVKVFVESFRTTFERKIDLIALKYKLSSADAAKLRKETIEAINEAS